MKKYRFSALLLILVLLTGLLCPVFAADAPAEAPEPVTHLEVGEGKAFSQRLADMEIDGTSALLMDQDTGIILYEQNIHELRYPASITKVMTALLTIEAIERGELDKDMMVTAGPELKLEVGAGSSTQNIQLGEEMRLEDILYCALTASANEACNMLAQAVTGKVDPFIALMNQRARELGMMDTRFANTHGYHNPNHYTTAYDISLMCREAMRHEMFREIVSTVRYTVPATNLSGERELHETNALISNFRYVGYYYSYATGIKTGSTDEAGYCLASSATKDNVNLIGVVLGCERVPGTTGSEGMTQFSESRRLLQWGFDTFAETHILDSTGFYYEIPVTLSSQVNYVGIEPKGSLSAILPVDLDPKEFKKEITLNAASVEAPVEKGQVLGSITVSNNGVEYGTLDLVAVANVERSEVLYHVDRTERFFAKPQVRMVILAAAILLLLLCLRWLIFGSKRKRERDSAARQRRGGGYQGPNRRQ